MGGNGVSQECEVATSQALSGSLLLVMATSGNNNNTRTKFLMDRTD